jgi:carboxypeptidase C (cathepsin A)
MTTSIRLATLLIACLMLPVFSFADESTAKTDDEPKAPAQTDWSITEHEVEIDGKAVSYAATAGTIQLKDGKDKAKASMFFIAYTAEPAPGVNGKPQDRPVMFCFNGGPGSSSVWLHMGCFGPRRVHMDDVGHAVGPPYDLKDNALSLLDTTDLVFIDPVSTGFSRVEEGTNASEYHSVSGDINSVAEFIRLWITKNDRWLSPKYLAGESYGTTRAAGVANRLQAKGVSLNGVVLVSAVLSFQTLRFDEGNDLPYQLYIPTYAALAHYHKQLPERYQDMALPDLLKMAEKWSREEYGPALMRGAELPEEERNAIAQELARLTALPQDLILDSNLRIPQWRFGGNLLKEQSNVIGRFDGRIVGPDLDKATDGSGATDPSYSRVAGGFTATFNDYVRGELGYETDMDYGILVGVRWNYDRAKSNYLNVAGDLRTAMAENPKLRVYVAAGYYDLATPYHAAEYTINHSITHPHARKRVTFGYFESGHMVFTHQPSLKKLRGELVDFFIEKAE